MVPELTPPVERFHRVLVEEIARTNPDYLRTPFTVAEIYQRLVPYRSHRDAIGVEMNGDYEDALLRLLAGAGGLLMLHSDPARSSLQRELDSKNPNTGLFREYADARVQLNPETLRAFGVAAVESPPRPPADSAEPGSATRGARVAVDAREPESAQWNKASRSDTNGLASDRAPTVEPRTPRGPAERSPSPKEMTAGSTPVPGGAGSVTKPSPCPWCDGELPGDRVVNFCPHCGRSVSLRPCPDCGEEMELSWRYCVNCGASSQQVADG
jgi:hypothetical protein